MVECPHTERDLFIFRLCAVIMTNAIFCSGVTHNTLYPFMNLMGDVIVSFFTKVALFRVLLGIFDAQMSQVSVCLDAENMCR